MLLLTLPWCPVDRAYAVGSVQIEPFPSEGGDLSVESRVARVMGVYRDLQGQPVRKAALVRWQGKPLLADLNDTELAEAREMVEIACFAALAKRDLFMPWGRYCNRGAFSFYVQWVTPDMDMIGLVTARVRGVGSHLSGWPLEDLRISVPVHVSPVNDVSIDQAVVDGLLGFRLRAGGKWTEWLHAIMCFNLANTDSDSVPYAAEWVLLCGAFQQVLEARSDAEDVAARFAASLTPLRDVPAWSSRRDQARFDKRSNLPLRQEWMREFWRIRGNLAHGWLDPRQPAAWSVAEHMALARLVFPLLVKVGLSKAGYYGLTVEDRAWICAFEELADDRSVLASPEAVGEVVRRWRWEVI